MIDVPIVSEQTDDYLDIIAHNYEQFIKVLDVYLENGQDLRYLEECNRFHNLLRKMIADNFLEEQEFL